MLALIEEVLQSGAPRPATRSPGCWPYGVGAADNGCRRLVEYETRLNYVLPKYDDPVICTYDLSRSARAGHGHHADAPVVIIGGSCRRTVLRSSDQFLLEIRSEVGSQERRMAS